MGDGPWYPGPWRWTSGLTSLGRLSGLITAVLLLSQVALMARVPVLESAFGQDQLARIHRLVGFTSFNLMLTHIVAITWGYAAGEPTRTPGTLWDLTVSYPGNAVGDRRHRMPVHGRRHQHPGRTAPHPV